MMIVMIGICKYVPMFENCYVLDRSYIPTINALLQPSGGRLSLRLQHQEHPHQGRGDPGGGGGRVGLQVRVL